MFVILDIKGCFCEVEDIPDADVQEKLKEIMKCSENEFKIIINQFPERFDSGYVVHNPSYAHRADFIKKIAHHYIISKCLGEIMQFTEGLQALGLFDSMKEDPEEAVKIFMYSDELINAEAIKKLFIPQFSKKQSPEEEDIYFNLLNFVDEVGQGKISEVMAFTYLDIEEGRVDESDKSKRIIKLGDILYFLTGSRFLTGFNDSIKVSFCNENYGCVTVSTCTYELCFPITNLYTGNNFSHTFTCDIINSPGYGSV